MAYTSTFFEGDYVGGRKRGPLYDTPPETAVQINPQVASLNAQSAQDQANAAAEEAKAAGLAKEADAYRMAAGIAGSSASLEDQATAITRFQQQRQVRATVAGQRADVAAAGFKESGSALSLLRESISQGAITDALTAVQGNINKNGYLAQQAAAAGEQQSALTSSAAAAALAKSYAASGVLATSLSANLANEIKATTTRYPSEMETRDGGVSGFTVRGGSGGGSDPFLEGSLVNPAYTGQGGGGGIGTGHVADAPVVNAGTAVPRGGSAGGGGNVQLPGGSLSPPAEPSAADLANAEQSVSFDC